MNEQEIKEALEKIEEIEFTLDVLIKCLRSKDFDIPEVTRCKQCNRLTTSAQRGLCGNCL